MDDMYMCMHMHMYMLSMSLIATAMHQECTSITALVACIADKLRFSAGRALIESLGCAGALSTPSLAQSERTAS